MRLTRLTALRAAILLAVGFVVLRVLYRAVFGGAGGGGVVLLDLPRIRLAGPFEHITLLGPITTGGLVNAAVSALPFAALVLVVGVLAAVIDLRALLTRGASHGPVRTVSRALVVAWSTFPALLDAVRRVRIARELRAERSAASLIVPILEQTVERAIALGASMEVRGFAATRRAEPVCERPVVLRDVSLGYDGRWSIEHLDLDLAPGTLTLVTGPTGSGKSTLLDALSGLFQHVADGDQLGTIEVAGVDRAATPPRETAGFVGVVFQSVRLSFVAATVAEEIGFALATRGVAPGIVAARVEEVGERLGILHLLDRPIGALSAGEACIVAIGAAIVERPVVLLADEPLADLDDAARARVVRALGALAHDGGVCVVVAEHAVREWGDLPDRRVELGRPGAGDDVAGDLGFARSPRGGATVLAVQGVSVSHGEQVAVDEAGFELGAGEFVALRGPNGAGKSSLLQAIALPRRDGAVLVDGVDVHRLHRRERRTAVALVPEQFDDLLFSTTVAAECRRADRHARRGAATTAERFGELIGPRDVMGAHPRDLSAGERLCLALAIQLAAEPKVLLVDEPTRGLDPAARRMVGSALAAAAASGTAVLMATHDAEFAERYATRTIRMAEGRVETSAEVGA